MKEFGATYVPVVLVVLAVGAILVSGASSSTAAQTAGEQIESGRALFADRCAICHGAEAQGGAGPALDRRTLVAYRSGARLFSYVSTSMPLTNPGGLSEQEYYDVVAFLLDLNGLNPDGVPVDVSTLPDLVLGE